MNRHIRNWLASLTLPFTLGLPQAHAYVHPGAPLTLSDLQELKANVANNREPWKSGYASLAAGTQLTYTMQGPFAQVSRVGAYDANLAEWRSDMNAIWNFARMWYFTGDTAYAQKAHDILLAWANTNTEFSGNESMLDLGDYAPRFVGGADILRGTWPGWTEADTTAVKAYFANVLQPGANPWGESMYGAANKGALALVAQGLMAIFNDDTATLDRVTYQARTLAHVGLRSSNDIGMLGDSLRDQGHAQVQLFSLTMLAEALWKQGIDIYSDHDNRLLAAGEYYARVNDLSVATPFLPFGTTDAYYNNDVTNRGFGAGNTTFSILYNAYVVRKGIPAPNMSRRLQEVPPDFMFLKDADLSTATPAPALAIPATTSITSGFSDAEIGGASPAGNSSYSGGTWTVVGSGLNIWSTGDSCHFTYQAVTGDCAIIAKVESVQNTHVSARAGVMIRSSLSDGAPRAWMAVTPSSQLQQNIQGLAVYGGSNYGNKSYAIPQSSYWVKLERLGNMVTGSVSQDGTNWAATDVGRLDNPPATWYVGLVVSSTSGTLNTSTFSNVQITGGDGGAQAVIPAAPSAFLAAGGENVVALRWQPSLRATSYTIQRATTSGGPYSTIASGVTASNYTDKTVTNGTTYYYVVTAVNSAGTSTDSPEDSATPISPMVNLAFGGTATSSTIGVPSGEAPGQAFDSNSASKWYNGNAFNPSPTGSLRYDFGPGNEQTVKRYTVVSADVANRDPKTWTFQGSNDESTWTTLDTQSNQAFLTRNHANVYNLGNTTAYRYYQIDVTANNGATTLAIAELGLWSDTGRTIPDGTYRILNRKSKKVMDVSAGSTANGAQLVQWTYGGGNSQQWDIAWQGGNGQYRATGVASAKVVDNGGTSTAGANLVIQPWNEGTSQLWKIVPDSDTFYHLGSANSGLVADLIGESTADGANIIQSTYSGSDNQQWMPIMISAAPVSPVLVNHWKFDETSGATAADSVGGKNGTLVNGPVWTSGQLGNAVDLDGVNDYVSLPTGVIAGLNDFTISAWVKLNSTSSNTRIFDFGTSTSNYLELCPKNGSTGYLRYEIVSSGTYRWINTTYTFPTGTWTHVAVTQSGSTGTLYVNGTAVGSNAAMSLNPSSLGFTTQNYIGKSQFSTDPYLGGSLDDFRLYKYALNGADIAALASMSGGTAPAAPTGLTATAASASQINLAWTASSGVDSYNVKRATASGGPYTTLATGLTSANYSDSGLSAGTSYHYVVSGNNAGGEGSNSAEASAITIPSAPTGLNATAVSSVQINLAWSASNGATSYSVKRSTTSGGPYTNLATGLSSAAYSDTGLSSGTSYYYIVTAVNASGESTSSAEASALTIPASPDNVTVTGGNGQATISWSASTGASSYTLERATSAGGPFTLVASGVTGLSYLDTGLGNGTSYYYRVSAGNASGSSGTSAVGSSITLPAAPQGLVATAGNTSVSLIWNASTGSGSYSVLRSVTSGSGYAVIASGLTATSYNDSSLVNGTAYYYVVTATNASGTSATSSQATATPIGLPSPWVTVDVGAVAATGTANHNAGTFTIEGSGAGIGGSADEFRYVYQSGSGDCDIIAQVTSIENTSASAKVGIVVRESTATGSRYAGVFLTPGGVVNFQRRTTTNGNTTTSTASSITVPRYIRLTRTGNTFRAYHSTNGTTWTQFGGNRSVTLTTAVNIGMGVSSNADGTLCTGTFSNVSVTP